METSCQLRSQSLKFFPSRLAMYFAILATASCSSVPKTQYVLELGGVQDISCEITNDKVTVGTFVVPATINLGSNVGNIEANCSLDDTSVNAAMSLSVSDCRDQIVVKGSCSRLTGSVGSVEVVIRKAN